jgi:hypothetical protein
MAFYAMTEQRGETIERGKRGRIRNEREIKKKM